MKSKIKTNEIKFITMYNADDEQIGDMRYTLSVIEKELTQNSVLSVELYQALRLLNEDLTRILRKHNEYSKDI